jgi:hypothetical protein
MLNELIDLYCHLLLLLLCPAMATIHSLSSIPENNY